MVADRFQEAETQNRDRKGTALHGRRSLTVAVLSFCGSDFQSMMLK